MRWSIQGALLLVVAVVSSAQPCRGPNCQDAEDVAEMPWVFCFGTQVNRCCYLAQLVVYRCPSTGMGGYYIRQLCWISMPGCLDSTNCIANAGYTLEELLGALRMDVFSSDPYNWFTMYPMVRVIHPSCWRVESSCFVACTEGDPCCYMEGPPGNPGVRQNTVVPVQCDPNCQNVCP